MHDRIDPFVTRVARSVRALHELRGRRPPRHIGCCVLFKANGERFLLTAAHVVEEFLHSEMHLGGDGEFVGIEGRGERARQRSACSTEEDLLDFGVLRLNSGVAERLDESFLTIADVDVRDWRHPCAQYLLFGYPASKVGLDYANRRIKGKPFRFVGPLVSEARHETYGVSRNTHVALDFDIEHTSTDTGTTKAPSPRGVSGAGMWSLPQLSDRYAIREGKLAAIFIAHPRKLQLLVGTRVFYHIELIRQRWPDVSSGLPDFGGPPLSLAPE
jgi:hypothetical protein